MDVCRNAPSAFSVTLYGLLGLASAMGIGRFAFTPLFPLMQEQGGVSLAQGAWLAFANYLGYLAGALASYAWSPSPRNAMRVGLLIVALTTAAMAIVHGTPGQLALRFAAGAASALVLVGVAGWAPATLATMGRERLAGAVFAGVGCGVVMAGLVALVAGKAAWTPDAAWLALGGLALAVVLAGWSALGTAVHPRTVTERRPVRPFDASEWSLIVAYGGFGLGYIVPATFLPAMARSVVSDPLVFGWAWPLFGAAAALSTLIASRWLDDVPPRTMFLWGLLVLGVGVLVPVLSASLLAIAVAALCVGGTFVVMTMAGFQEGRRIASGPPARVIAAMTAAFALGQLAGPVLVALQPAGGNGIVVSSLIATAALVVSMFLLAFGPRTGRIDNPATPTRKTPS